MYLYYSRHLPSRDLHDRRIQRNRVRHGTTLDGRVRLETCVCGMRENKDVLTLGNLNCARARLTPKAQFVSLALLLRAVCFADPGSVGRGGPRLGRSTHVWALTVQHDCVYLYILLEGCMSQRSKLLKIINHKVKTTKLSSRAIRNVLLPSCEVVITSTLHSFLLKTTVNSGLWMLTRCLNNFIGGVHVNAAAILGSNALVGWDAWWHPSQASTDQHPTPSVTHGLSVCVFRASGLS